MSMQATRERVEPSKGDVVLEARGLKKYFPIRGGVLGKVVGYVRAVDGVDLKVRRGEILALVGESGSGKSTLGRVLIGLSKPTEGQVLYKGRDLFKLLKSREGREVRHRLQIIFQNPDASLNPRMLVSDILAEAILEKNPGLTRDEVIERALGLLERVGLNPDHAYKYPVELSGGEKQRVAIARAIAMEPEVIIADEPVSALDVSIRAQILNLILELHESMRNSIVFIAHDLGVVWNISDRIAVMYSGKIVEEGLPEEVFKNPKHPYTMILIESAPRAPFKRNDPRLKPRGEPPSPINPPPGCRFHTRCPFATDKCRTEEPPRIGVSPTHYAYCHYVDQVP